MTRRGGGGGMMSDRMAPPHMAGCRRCSLSLGCGDAGWAGVSGTVGWGGRESELAVAGGGVGCVMRNCGVRGRGVGGWHGRVLSSRVDA